MIYDRLLDGQAQASRAGTDDILGADIVCIDCGFRDRSARRGYAEMVPHPEQLLSDQLLRWRLGLFAALTLISAANVQDIYGGCFDDKQNPVALKNHLPNLRA